MKFHFELATATKENIPHHVGCFLFCYNSFYGNKSTSCSNSRKRWQDSDQAIINEVKSKAGIDIVVKQKLSWDTEVKNDLDGIRKFFIYLDVICEYTGGELTLSEGIEKLEWVNINDLGRYDIVPPSKILFKKLGYS